MPSKSRKVFLQRGWIHRFGEDRIDLDSQELLETIDHSNGRNWANDLSSYQYDVKRRQLTNAGFYFGSPIFGIYNAARLGIELPPMAGSSTPLLGYAAKGYRRLAAKVLNPGDLGQTAAEVLRDARHLNQFGQALNSLKLGGFNSNNLPRGARGVASLIRLLSRGNLTYQFGIKPTVDSIAHSISAMKTLRDDYKKATKWQSCQFTLHSSKSSSTTSHVSLTDNSLLGMPVRDTKATWSDEEKIWYSGHIRLKPGVDIGTFSDVVNGLELDGRLLYQLAPYTWLSDWVLPVGDLLDNIRNSRLVETRYLCTMGKYTSKYAGSATVGDIPSGVASTEVTLTHRRRIPSGAVTFGSLPLKLDAWRSGILLSLAGARL